MKKPLIIALILILLLTGCSSPASNKTEVPTETDKSTESDVQNVEVDVKEVLENKFDALPIEARMERLLNDVNQYTWNMDDLQIVKEEFVKSIFYMNEDSKKYINETYIYEIPSSYDFDVNIDSTGSQGTIYKYDGDTYAFVYNSIFNENITLEGTMDIYPYDPPILDTILVSYNKTDLNTYDIIGAYEGTGRIMITVEYSNCGMVIKSIERYEEKGSIGQFKIEEIKEIPSGNINLMEITNPAYQNEPDSNLTTYIFSIEGKYDVIGVFTIKTMDSEQEVYDLDVGGENIVLKYKTMFPTDFSQDTLLIRSAGGTDYEMQLNDAVDRELYLFEE